MMKPFTSGEVMVSRFFAPKITDASGKTNAHAYVWRKLVRLRALVDSDAAKVGLQSMYLLFNVFSRSLKIAPFVTDEWGREPLGEQPGDPDSRDDRWQERLDVPGIPGTSAGAGGPLGCGTFSGWDSLRPTTAP